MCVYRRELFFYLFFICTICVLGIIHISSVINTTLNPNPANWTKKIAKCVSIIFVDMEKILTFLIIQKQTKYTQKNTYANKIFHTFDLRY